MKHNRKSVGLVAAASCALVGAASAQTTSRVSVNSLGVQGTLDSARSSKPSAISADGRFIAFSSYSFNLVSGDTNGREDVFVRDTQEGTTARVSVRSSGEQGNGDSYVPSISADGRFVTFLSLANNLVADDANNNFDVFLHDTVTGLTTRVSVSSNGTEGNAGSHNSDVSDDGRYVVFHSEASNLVAGDANNLSDIFVHDTLTGQTSLVSLSSSGTQGDGGSSGPCVISGNGRFVAFESVATIFVSPDINNDFDVFVRDLQTAQTTRVSVSSSGVQANQAVNNPSISTDGRFVAFQSDADNLVQKDNNSSRDVFVHDREQNRTVRINRRPTGEEGNGASGNVSISNDGRFVAFVSAATNLLGPGADTNGVDDIFLVDRDTAALSRVSVDSSAMQATGASASPAISADGRFVAFNSDAPDLVPADTNNVDDYFIRSLFPVQSPSPFPAGDLPTAIAIADFDADALGRPDLAVVNAGSNTVTLLLNNGVAGAEPSFAAPSPAFTFSVGDQPRAIAASDIDDDGDPDLAVLNGLSGSVSILLNDGEGVFVAAPSVGATLSPRALSLADLDADNLPDLIVARHDADAIAIHRNTGGGAFGPDQPQAVPPGGRPSGVGSGDLDNDKDVDVVAALDQAGAILFFPNTSPAPGQISFGPAQPFSVGAGTPRPVSVALQDLDADGFLDVVTANEDGNSLSVLRNLGLSGGVWLGLAPAISFTVGSTPVSVGSGQVFATGRSDLFTANAFVDGNNESSVSILKNVSTGPGDIAFEPELRVGVPPRAAHITAGDVNLDSRLDIALAIGFDATAGLDGAPRVGAGVVVVLAGASPSVVLSPCPADANGDRAVNLLDLSIVLDSYGLTGPAVPGDVDANGVVDFIDLNLVLGEFGASC